MNRCIFRNYRCLLVQAEYSLHSTWTMKGLQMDAVKPKSFETKTVISKRLESVEFENRSGPF
jgi:hypothetical protein